VRAKPERSATVDSGGGGEVARAGRTGAARAAATSGARNRAGRRVMASGGGGQADIMHATAAGSSRGAADALAFALPSARSTRMSTDHVAPGSGRMPRQIPYIIGNEACE